MKIPECTDLKENATKEEIALWESFMVSNHALLAFNWDECLLSNEPVTDEEFDNFMGLPAGSTRIKQEQDYWNKINSLYTGDL